MRRGDDHPGDERAHPATRGDLARLEFLIGLGVLFLNSKLDQIINLEASEMSDLTQITAEVAENTDAVQSAVSLLTTLADEIRSNATDPAALAALADSLDANNKALADAVVANTPAAPEPPPEV